MSEASIVRAHTPSQGGGTRTQTAGDEAENPFADLLDSCGLSDGDSAGAPQAAGETAVADAPVEVKAQTDTPIVPEKAPTSADDAAEAFSAELLLLLAMTGQPVTEPKEKKPATDAVSGELIVQEAQAETESTKSQADISDAVDAPAVGVPVPVPAPLPAPEPPAVAIAVPLPVATPAEGTAAPPPASDLPAATPVVAADVSDQINIDAAETEKVPQSAEAIEATIEAHADKNKKLAAEKPTSTAAERTLETPAAFRSAAGVERPAPKTESPKADIKAEIPDQPGAAPKETVPVMKNSPDHSDPADAKLTTDVSPPSPDPTPDAPVQPGLLQANMGPQQVTQPVVVQPDLNRPVPVAGLAVEIAAHAQAGKNRFEIRLDPPELGRIDVRLDVGSDGQVTSHLRVERAETLDLLRRDAPMLERALQQAGLKTSDNGLQFSLRDQSFSWQQQQQQANEMPDVARLVLSDEIVPVETPRQYGRLAGVGGGVDIRV